MNKLSVSTKNRKQIVDITDTIEEYLAKQEKANGIVALFLQHTTASITTADLDEGTDLDMLDAFNELIPKLPYRHPHNPSHVPDHILSSIIGPSVVVPFKNKQLQLGTWQRIVLVELDGPRERNIIVNVIG